MMGDRPDRMMGEAAQRPLETLEQDYRKRQEQVAHGISHDLRAPLRVIGSYAERLTKRHGDRLDDEARGYLDRIAESVDRMEGLIDGLLQLSWVERAPFHPSEVDLSLLVDWTLAELQDTYPDRKAAVDVAPGLQATGDERLLKLLLEKLLDNAWRFSGEREQIEIRVEAERRGDTLVVDVTDRGIGFNMRYVESIFDPFQRLHGEDRGGGHGLGLAIAKAVVQRHGGSISATSEPDTGSTFRFELPIEHQTDS